MFLQGKSKFSPLETRKFRYYLYLSIHVKCIPVALIKPTGIRTLANLAYWSIHFTITEL